MSTTSLVMCGAMVEPTSAAGRAAAMAPALLAATKPTSGSGSPWSLAKMGVYSAAARLPTLDATAGRCVASALRIFQDLSWASSLARSLMAATPSEEPAEALATAGRLATASTRTLSASVWPVAGVDADAKPRSAERSSGATPALSLALAATSPMATAAARRTMGDSSAQSFMSVLRSSDTASPPPLACSHFAYTAARMRHTETRPVNHTPSPQRRLIMGGKCSSTAAGEACSTMEFMVLVAASRTSVSSVTQSVSSGATSTGSRPPMSLTRSSCSARR
mmetsp:Transcript_24886/g.83427  ORF Transcript_24886/g.83427 Transcript_24886/m.83427 type:complete len:279 (-) Transcript_24886:320-1156(-)